MAQSNAISVKKQIICKPIIQHFSLYNSTRKQKILLLGLCLSDMFSSMSLSIMGPFFPQENVINSKSFCSRPRRFLSLFLFINNNLYLVTMAQSNAISVKKQIICKPIIQHFSLYNSTRKQKILLLGLCLSDMFSSMSLSIMGPFFPQEAEKRNISVTVSGWIFGVFALTQILMSPICGKMMSKFGSRFMYLAGLFLSGGSIILMGFLEYIPIVKDGMNADFIMFCFILRIILGIGCSAQDCANFTIISLEFQNDVSTVIGICEVFVGIGLGVGPVLGGTLYAVGGFILPFAVIGSLILAIIPLNFWILSKIKDQTFDKVDIIMVLFKNPLVLVTCLAIMIASTVRAGLDPILEPHLRIFSLSSPIVGLLFLLMSVTYAISSPFWGRLSDNTSDKKNLLIPGFYLMGISLLFLGPSPFLKIQEDYLWLNILCLAVLGISISLAVVPTYNMLLEHAENAGFAASVSTHGIVAGIWNSVFGCGEFVGPTLSGYLVDVVGFQLSLTYIAIGCFSAGSLLLFLRLLSCFSKCFSRLSQENIEKF